MKYAVVYNNLKWKIYGSDISEDLINELVLEINQTCKQQKKGNPIIAIKFLGKTYNYESRPISQKVRVIFKNQPCVICGSFSDTVIDHKNYLYDNNKVLNVKTQFFTDFQVLCNSCNLKKREIANKTLKYNVLQSISVIPQFSNLKETFDLRDLKNVDKTYWYDPITFWKNRLFYKVNQN